MLMVYRMVCSGESYVFLFKNKPYLDLKGTVIACGAK